MVIMVIHESTVEWRRPWYDCGIEKVHDVMFASTTEELHGEQEGCHMGHKNNDRGHLGFGRE